MVSNPTAPPLSPPAQEPAPASTVGKDYAERLQRLSARGGAVRHWLDPQRPYRWNLRRLQPGFMLDIGCGIGRNLRHIAGNGVGVDHNVDCVEACRAAGLTAFTVDEFQSSGFADVNRFDSLLFAHVLEHMTETESVELVRKYLPYLRPGGKVIVITPQERGQASDPTHVVQIDPAAVRRIAVRSGLQAAAITSFPFPSIVGRIFTHNETVSVLTERPAV